MRRSASVLAVFALALAGCGGTTSDVGQSAADIVPADAAAFVALDTDPGSDQWQAVQSLADRFPDKQKGVDEIKQSLRKDSGLDWDEEVSPALGKELAFVWLDFEHGGDDFVGLMQPKSKAKLDQLIAKGNKQDPSSKVVYEKFGDWVVLGRNQEIIDRFEQASAAAKGTLAGEFGKSIKKLSGDALVRAYVNGEQVLRFAREQGGPDAQQYIDKAGTLDWIALRLGATHDGIGFDAIVRGTLGKLFSGVPHTDSFDARLPKTAPADALFYLTFHGAKNMLAGLRQNPVLRTPELRRYSGLFAKIGKLLQGENALYIRPGKGRIPDVPVKIPEVTLVADPGPGVDGVDIIDLLFIRYASDSFFVPEPTRIAGIPARKLDFGSGNVAGYYANVDGKLVVTDLPSGIEGAKRGGKSLAESDDYRDAARASELPGRTQGFLYVNVHTSIPFVARLAEQSLPADVARNLKPLRSAVEYAVSRTHEVQVTVFLRIK